MASATLEQDRISIGSETVREAREAVRADLRHATLILRGPDGTEQVLPQNLQKVLLDAMISLAGNGGVTIGQVPEDLSSTVAADLLGVSRPTLLKWARAGEIESFSVGSHTRFKRDVVMDKKEQRAKMRKNAFAELRALDAEFHGELED